MLQYDIITWNVTDPSTYGRKTTGLKLGQSCPWVWHECVRGSGCKAPNISYLAIRWTWLVSLRPRHIYTLRKCSSGYSGGGGALISSRNWTTFLASLIQPVAIQNVLYVFINSSIITVLNISLYLETQKYNSMSRWPWSGTEAQDSQV
jgi:hypothetical protein